MATYSQHEPYLENPFRNDLVILNKAKYVTMESKTDVILDKRTGGEKSLTFKKRVDIDSENFVKIYQSQIKRLIGLNNTANKVFKFMCFQLVKDNEVVHIPMKECMTFCKFSTRKSYYDGISELLNKKLIAKTAREDYYYVDLNLVFNGNRINIITEYYKNDV